MYLQALFLKKLLYIVLWKNEGKIHEREKWGIKENAELNQETKEKTLHCSMTVVREASECP